MFRRIISVVLFTAAAVGLSRLCVILGEHLGRFVNRISQNARVEL